MSSVMQGKESQENSIHNTQQEQPGGPPVGVADGEQPFQEPIEPPQQGLQGATEPVEEGVLYVADTDLCEESESIESIVSDTEQGDLQPADPASEANLPFPVPREMCLHIFSFLNTAHLQSTAIVSRQSYSLSAEIRKRQFLAKHSNSHWWKFLVALADNVPGEGEKKFVEVLILGMGPNIRIPNGWREANVTLSSYVTQRMRWFPGKIQCLGLGISGYEDIQKKAQTLLDLMCAAHDRTALNACTQLRGCYALVEDKNKVVAFQHYDDLDRIFSCLILFELMRGEQTNNRVNFLISTPFARGLTGAGLIALECQFEGIFPALVREAIRLFQIQEKQEAELQRLKTTEKLLGRLTEADILRYIDTETDKPPFLYRIPLQRQLFVEILQSNYEFLMAKMTFAVLIRVECTIRGTNQFESLLLIPHFIKSHFILSRLTPEELLTMLKILRESQVAMVIHDHPVLQSYCTVEIMQELLKAKTCRSGVASVFLANKTLLDKLNDDHVVAFAEHFSDTDFDSVLESAAMLDRLRADASNSLLMRLAKIDNRTYFGRVVLANLVVSSLLTADQAVELFDFSTQNQTPLFDNNPLIDKLSSAQLIHLILKTIYSEYEKLIIDRRLHKFTKRDLMLLIQNFVSERKSTDMGNYLLTSLPPEIDRRLSHDIDADLRLDSEALCTLGCAHHQLASYILEHHGERLDTNEYLLIRNHYPPNSYDPNTPVRIAIAKERQRRLEIFERKSKAADTKPLMDSNPPASAPITRRVYSSYQQEKHKDPDRKTLPPLVSDEEWAMVYFIIQILCIIGAVLGLLLAISGIGSAVGVSIITSATHYLFASITMTQGVVAGILGIGTVIASSVGWLKTEEAKTNRFGAKNNFKAQETVDATHNLQFTEPDFDAQKPPHSLSVRKASSARKQVDSSLGVIEADRDEDSQSAFSMNN